MEMSASVAQCRASLSFFEQVSTISLRVVCMVISDGSPSIGWKTRSSAMYRLETTIPAAFGEKS